MVNLGDVFPNFEAQTKQGPIKFHEFLATGTVWEMCSFLSTHDELELRFERLLVKPGTSEHGTPKNGTPEHRNT